MRASTSRNHRGLHGIFLPLPRHLKFTECMLFSLVSVSLMVVFCYFCSICRSVYHELFGLLYYVEKACWKFSGKPIHVLYIAVVKRRLACLWPSGRRYFDHLPCSRNIHEFVASQLVPWKMELEKKVSCFMLFYIQAVTWCLHQLYRELVGTGW
jgi:hypothetical protein